MRHRDTGNIKAVFVEVDDEESLDRGLARNGEASAPAALLLGARPSAAAPPVGQSRTAQLQPRDGR